MNDPRILFEDESLVVIDKPYGVVVNNAESVKSETIQTWFIQKYKIPSGELEFLQKGGVVHRLDKDTSGVMVLAKTPEAYEKLKQQFLERKTVKKYIALVHGEFKEQEGIISTPLERRGAKFFVGGDLSKTAITEWKVIRQCSMFNVQCSMVELTPHTGRTHQLRVHMRHLGHPIVSDPIYGDRKTWKKDLEVCPRLFLHAKSLEIAHPMTGEKMVFEAQLPEELEKMVH